MHDYGLIDTVEGGQAPYLALIPDLDHERGRLRKIDPME
jgi:hypothetical protein